MKEKTINLKAFHVEFARNGTQYFIATVLGDTPGGKSVRVKFELKFGCLPWILRKLAEQWKFARENRLAEINAVDKVLPY